MENLIRPTWPAKPSNPPSSMGAPSNVGGGTEKPLIRPQYPALPSNPGAGMGTPATVGGGRDLPVVRGGTSGPTG